MKLLSQSVPNLPSPFKYRTIGRGPRSAVLIHGFGNNGSAWLPFLLSGRREDFTFYLVDLPGAGSSKKIPLPNADPDVLKIYADCIHSLLENLDLKDVALAGFSMGAYCGLKLAADGRFERIAAYLHVDHPPFSINTEDWRGGLDPSLLAEFEKLCDVVDRGESAEKVRATFIHVLDQIGDQSLSTAFGRSLNHFLHRVPILKELAAERVDFAWGYQMIMHYAQGTYDLRSALSQIPCPVTLVNGRHSKICNVRATEFMRGEIPEVRAMTFDKSGHDLMLNEPVKFQRVLNEFLSF